LLVFVESGEAIEQRCFAGPIRTDETDDLSAANIERDPIERDDATKSHAQRRDAKQRYIRNRRRRCHCRHYLPADRHLVTFESMDQILILTPVTRLRAGAWICGRY